MSNTSTLLGFVTIGVLLFGSISFYLDARGGGSTMTVALTLFAFAMVRLVLLVADLRRKRARKKPPTPP